jgi:hypothetical protein
MLRVATEMESEARKKRKLFHKSHEICHRVFHMPWQVFLPPRKANSKNQHRCGKKIGGSKLTKIVINFYDLEST